MKKLALYLYFVAVAALAQTARTITIDDPNFAWVLSEVRPASDGGCLFTSYASNDAGFDFHAPTDDFSGARCTTVRTAAAKQINRASGGDAGAP